MRVSCSLCGGENEILPGQKMLFCSFCGSALALEERTGPERLILPHERNDRLAADALRSHLSIAGRAAPGEIRVEFSYVPFLMIENEKGDPVASPCRGAPSGTGPIPAPPAGDYRFFDDSLAGGEKIVPFDPADADAPGVLRVLHLPLYRLLYRAGGKKRRALVMGESLYVYADDLPPRRAPAPSAPGLVAALALTAAFLLVGRLGHSLPARGLVIAAAAAAGWAVFALRSRMVRTDG
ncbi:MAG: hypothetical protein PHQ19_04510 [Candidatus Krumholzibacteria bacterium]|nr:hypothetical protein [Candidatus Krumholzibacteria bacterium]